MKKTRNINVQGNVFSYAGPVGGGRSSRKSPESFSSASPPVSFFSVIKFLRKGLSFLSIALIIGLTVLTTTGCEVPNGGNEIEEEENEEDDYRSLQSFLKNIPEEDFINVDILYVLNISAQSTISSSLTDATTLFANQSNKILQLSGTLADNNKVKDAEEYIADKFEGHGDGLVILGMVKNKYMDLMEELCALSANKDMYRAQIEAFRRASYLKQRQLMDDKDTQVNALLQQVLPLLDKTSAPKGTDVTADVIAAALAEELGRDMPEAAGDAGIYILQQLGDFSEYEGWIDDVAARGLYPHVLEQEANRLNPHNK